MAYELSISIALGPAKAGLSLRAALFDKAGAIDATHRDISTGFVEIGGGRYLWTYAAMPDGFRGGVQLYTGTLGPAATDFSGVTLHGAPAAINPQEVESGGASVDPRGPGSNLVPLVVTEDGTEGGVPVENAQVWLTTDAAGTNTIAGFLLTNSSGVVKFMVDYKSEEDGDDPYYVWAQKDGRQYVAAYPWYPEEE